MTPLASPTSAMEAHRAPSVGGASSGPCVCFGAAAVKSKLVLKSLRSVDLRNDLHPFEVWALLSSRASLPEREGRARGPGEGRRLAAAGLPGPGGRRNLWAAAGTWPRRGTGTLCPAARPLHKTHPCSTASDTRALGPDLPGSSQACAGGAGVLTTLGRHTQPAADSWWGQGDSGHTARLSGLCLALEGQAQALPDCLALSR